MSSDALQQKFARALDALIAEVKAARTILAAILCGRRRMFRPRSMR
jgi:hypothetical protein